MKVVQLLGLQGQKLPPQQELRPYRVFSSLLDLAMRRLFGQSFSVAPPVQALRGILCQGSFCVYIRHIEGLPPPRRSAHQALKGAGWVGSCSVVQSVRRLMVSLYSAAGAGVWRERGMVMVPPHTWDYGVGQYRLASMAACLSSSHPHHDLLPRIPSLGLSAVNRSPHLGIAPQSLNSSSQSPPLPGDLHFCLAYVWLQQGLSDSHSI